MKAEQNNAASKNVEEFALTPVPASERKSWVEVAFVQAGIFICVPNLMLGALLAGSMPVGQAILAGALGTGLVILLTFILGMQGADLGVPTCAVCLSTFGRSGTRIIVSSLFAISLMGWFGLQTSVCGEAFVNIMREAFGIEIPLAVSSIAWGFIMLLTAVFGMNALKKLDSLSIPLLVIIMLIGTYMAVKNYGTGGLAVEVEQTMSLVSGIGLAFSFSAVGAITAADITRFQRDRRDTIKSSLWGILPASMLMLVLGVVMTKLAGVYDISYVMVAVGIPFLGIIVLILATWTTNSINAYCGGLDIVMTFNIPDNRRREATMAAGIVGILLSVLGILDHIESFLSYLSYAFSAIGGVMVADYWIVGKGKVENWHEVEGFNWAGIIAMAAAIIPAWILKIEYAAIPFGILAFLVIERFLPSASRPGSPLSANSMEK